MTTSSTQTQDRFEELVPYRPAIVNAMVRRGVDWHTAEDIAQETLVRAATAPDPIDGDPRSWLVTIAANLSRDLFRRAATQEKLRAHAEMRPGSFSFEAQVVDREVARQVLLELARSEGELTLRLVLGRMEGMTWAEVAASNGVTASAAQSRVRRALKPLRRLLKDLA